MLGAVRSRMLTAIYIKKERRWDPITSLTLNVDSYGQLIMLGVLELPVAIFFFQAEDGIRDLTVTGVQTCALPICADGRGRGGSAQNRSSWGDILSVSQIRGHCGAVLGRMFDGVTKHWRQMLVGEGVENVLRLAPSFDQTRREQNPEARGYRRDLLALVFGQFRDASLA